MTVREHFQAIVVRCIEDKIYPSPMEIQKRLGRRKGMHNLNSKECKWREEILTQLGWIHAVKNPKYHNRKLPRLRWEKPE